MNKALIDIIGGREDLVEKIRQLQADSDKGWNVDAYSLKVFKAFLSVIDAKPFMYAISDCDGKAHFDETCVSASACDLEDVVGSLNDCLESGDDGYRVVPVYAVTPAAIVPDVKPVYMPKPERLDGNGYGYYFDMDDVFKALDDANIRYLTVK